MSLPLLRKYPQSQRTSAVKFGGINLSDGTPAGEWEKLVNVEFDKFPAISTSKHKRYDVIPDGVTGTLYRNDDVVYTDATGIIVEGEHYDIELTEGLKNLVAMGAYVIILPDWVVFNTYTKTVENKIIDIEGHKLWEVNDQPVGANEKALNTRKVFFLDVDRNNPQLESIKIGDKYTIEFSDNFASDYEDISGKLDVTVAEITTTSVGGESVFKNYRSIVFEWEKSYPDCNYFYTINEKYAYGISVGRVCQFRKCRLSNVNMYDKMKEFDFVIEHNNRLWACSSKNHEIYCSKLGEPLAWGEYQGISTDSWTATVGTDGNFTGACVYNDNVLFFKENCVHIVHGTKPSNFQIATLTLRGVQRGCHESLCVCNSLLYYKAPEGIFCFNGNYSQKVDDRLGNVTASIGESNVVGVSDDKYVYMIIPGDKAYVYDYIHNLWYTQYTEDFDKAYQGFNINGCLYATTKENGIVEYIDWDAVPTQAIHLAKQTAIERYVESVEHSYMFYAMMRDEDNVYICCDENKMPIQVMLCDKFIPYDSYDMSVWLHFSENMEFWQPINVYDMSQFFHFFTDDYGSKTFKLQYSNSSPYASYKLYSLDGNEVDASSLSENAKGFMVYAEKALHTSQQTAPQFDDFDNLVSYINQYKAEKIVETNLANRILLTGIDTSEMIDDEQDFLFETGWLGRNNSEMRHFNKFNFEIGIDCSKESRVQFTIAFKYSDTDIWHTMYRFDSHNGIGRTEIFTVPIIPMRSQKVKIRITGKTVGNDNPQFTLYGMYYTTEAGSEIV